MSIRRTLTKFLWRFHRWGYRASDGGLGGRIVGMPVLLLTTTGRRSGRPRTTALTYLPDGRNLVIIASNGGAQQHPAWFLNLRAHPQAAVQVGKDRIAVRAHETAGEERDRLWIRAVRAYGGYAVYQSRTARTIPVIVLEPAHWLVANYRIHEVDSNSTSLATKDNPFRNPHNDRREHKHDRKTKGQSVDAS